jgi:hypothetical protein
MIIAVIAYQDIGGLGTSNSIVSVVAGGDALGLGTSADDAGTSIISNDIWYFVNSGAGVTSVTITQEKVTPMAITIMEFSGVPSDWDNVDAQANFGALDNTPITITVSPTAASNLVIASAAFTANDYSSGPTGGFTRSVHGGTGTVWLEPAYLIQSSAANATASWTLTAGLNWDTAIVVFNSP